MCAQGCGISSQSTLSSEQTLPTLLVLTAPVGSISAAVGGCVRHFAGGGGACCLLCKGSSLFLTPRPHFHLTHGSSRSRHLTTASAPTQNHMTSHRKTLASSSNQHSQTVTVCGAQKRGVISCQINKCLTILILGFVSSLAWLLLIFPIVCEVCCMVGSWVYQCQ